MKINKLMLALAVAASAFAACNKQETTPQVVNDNIGNKSIVLNIANVMPATKTPGTQIGATQVTLNDYQIFFVDGDGNFYAPKDSTASNTADTYFEVTEKSTLSHQFHFLDNNVTRVIVVGNKGKDFAPANETALWTALANVKIKDQQEDNVHNLILYGSDSNLTADAPIHDNFEDQHPTPVYKAVVNLKPAVARFEVTGYEYAQAKKKVKDPETGVETETLLPREYKQVVINNQSLIGFYESASLESTGETNWTVTPKDMHAFGWDATANKGEGAVVTYTWDNVYQQYFAKLTDADKAAWYYDAMTDVTLNAANTYVHNVATVTGEGDAATSDNKCYAYHVYPSTVDDVANVVPSFIFQITATDGTITTPMYLQTKGFTGLTEIAAGNVYQMNVKFDDSVLKAAEKCIDVEITVHKWVVTVVTPQF